MKNVGFTIWLTGLSGAGKSTLAQAIEQRLKTSIRDIEVLDGDIVRTHLSKGLGFSREDRDTNIKRIAFVCGLLTRHGVVNIAAAISPYRAAREWARQEIGNFVEVYVKCPIEVCRQRDVKGLYKQVDKGMLKSFTGIDDPYEEPEHPDLVIETDKETVAESVARIFARLMELGCLTAEEIYEEVE
jgi:adenylylsulfate kinase